MKVIIKGSPDIDSIPAAVLRPYASYIIEETKKFFGNPANMAEFEAWRKRRKMANGRV